jgi:hypothetical protein
VGDSSWTLGGLKSPVGILRTTCLRVKQGTARNLCIRSLVYGVWAFPRGSAAAAAGQNLGNGR